MLFQKLNEINILTPLVSIRPYSSDDFVDLNLSFDKAMMIWFVKDYVCFEDFIREKMYDKTLGNIIPFSIIDDKGKVFGITCVYELNDKNNSIEVGSTWIDKSYQGTGYNLLFKYYLFECLIEHVSLNRLQLKTDSKNLTSFNAMKSVGLNYEGRLLSHMIVKGGRVRDSEVFSVTKDTWVDIKSYMYIKLDKKFE